MDSLIFAFHQSYGQSSRNQKAAWFTVRLTLRTRPKSLDASRWVHAYTCLRLAGDAGTSGLAVVDFEGGSFGFCDHTGWLARLGKERCLWKVRTARSGSMTSFVF